MNEQIIRMIGTTIEDGLEAHDLLHDIAEAILNLKQKCKDCEGSGRSGIDYDPIIGLTGDICPTCKGTGGKRVLAIVEEK